MFSIYSKQVAELLSALGIWSFLISIGISIFISIIGVIPSVFMTTVNVLIFGFYPGFLLSWIGEVLGAGVSYNLYRLGVQRVNKLRRVNYLWLNNLNNMTPLRQFFILLLARLIPYVPSSIVTLVATTSSMTFLNYMLATAVGKLPSIWLETLLAYGYVKVENKSMKIIITIMSLLSLYIIIHTSKMKNGKLNEIHENDH